MEKITSMNNNRIVMYSKLNTKKYRDEYNLFLLENYKLVKEAIQRNEEIEAVIINESNMEKLKNIIELLNEKIIIVPENVFSKISDTVSSQGIIAVIKKPDHMNISSCSGKILVLDRVQDAGNVGTLLRSASGFGFSTVILIESADPYSPKVIRSSGGSIFNLNIIETTEKELIREINKKNYALYTADMNGTNLYSINKFPENMMVVIGNEGQGVSSALEEASTDNIMIPMEQTLESLNAGVSGSIIMSYIHAKK